MSNEPRFMLIKGVNKVGSTQFFVVNPNDRYKSVSVGCLDYLTANGAVRTRDVNHGCIIDRLTSERLLTMVMHPEYIGHYRTLKEVRNAIQMEELIS